MEQAHRRRSKGSCCNGAEGFQQTCAKMGVLHESDLNDTKIKDAVTIPVMAKADWTLWRHKYWKLEIDFIDNLRC